MVIDPYKRRPAPPTVCLLQPDGSAVSEHGELVDLDDPEPGYRMFAGWETVWRLVADGQGEALCWRNEEIRWRHRRRPEETERWQTRPGDVYVLRLPGLDQLPTEVCLRGLAGWRDWLAEEGAAPTGTTGSTSMSLLRATLERQLRTGRGERPPLRFTVGGRQETGPNGPGAYTETLAHLDMQAAYARTLAATRYGGWWQQLPGLPDDPLERPCFVRAQVRVPRELVFGPLLRRPRRPPRSLLEATLLAHPYPVGTRIQGVWTLEELRAAETAGCRIGRILAVWLHRSAWLPFEPWWLAVERGRRMRGLAGALAKMTGNALWGRFASDALLGGSRTIRAKEGRRVTHRRLPSRGQPWPAHDLAESVSGRVRARLYLMMLLQGSSLVSAHTDGVWTLDGSDILPDGWRHDKTASVLQLLGPQTLRYRPEPRPPWLARDGWETVYAGVPAGMAAGAFEQAWQKAALV